MTSACPRRPRRSCSAVTPSWWPATSGWSSGPRTSSCARSLTWGWTSARPCFGVYRGRGAARFALGFLLSSGVSLGVTALLLLLNGELRQDLNLALGQPDWQAWRAPRTEGLWQGSHWAYRLPVFIAYVAF